METAGTDFAAAGVTALVLLFACPVGVLAGLPIKPLLGFGLIVSLGQGFAVPACLIAVFLFTPDDVWWALLQRLERMAPDALARPSGTGPSGTGHGEGEAPWSGSFGRQQRKEAHTFKPVHGRKAIEPHRVLGIAPDASRREVEAARRRLAKAYHPDLHPKASRREKEALAARMRAVNTAYDRLKQQGFA